MKYIITESKLDKVAINWLNDNFGNLVPFETDEESDNIFYKKGDDTIFTYHKQNGLVDIDYDKIWIFFEKYFNMQYKEIRNLTKMWIEERYNLKVSTTIRTYPNKPFMIEEHYKLK
jgi:hypothetical protein